MNKLLEFNTSNFLANIFLRFYIEIIAGVWAILLMIPLDAYLYNIFQGEPSYHLGREFWIFLVIYSIFFLISAALVPKLKERRVIDEIEELSQNSHITYIQKKKIQSVIQNVLIYKSLFTKEGMLQFIMTNLFGIGVVFAYFGIEGFIANAMNGQTLVVPAIFVLCFLIVLIVESFLDDYLSNEIKKNNNIDISNKGLYGKNKTLLMLIMRNVGGGGSLSMKFSELLIEDAIDDIYEILHISSHVDESVKKKIITKINSRRSAKEMKSNKFKSPKVEKKKNTKKIKIAKKGTKKNIKKVKLKIVPIQPVKRHYIKKSKKIKKVNIDK